LLCICCDNVAAFQHKHAVTLSAVPG
jgi:hypothetical protein